MTGEITLGDIKVDVVFKNIKNVHLTVHPPAGRVRIAAPMRMKLETLRVFAISRLDWIKQQQKKMRAQERETPREYLERESHYVWGKRYLLKLVEADAAPRIDLTPRRIVLTIREGASAARKRAVLDDWFRSQIKLAAPAIIERWAPVLGVPLPRIHVQRMKTRWGSCSPERCSIRLNTDLAKKPSECLEYIVVHELMHLLEPRHNDRFVALLDQYMPTWRHHRDVLNRLPVSHEDWGY
jgi:predicted metal-dependent hydrolase